MNCSRKVNQSKIMLINPTIGAVTPQIVSPIPPVFEKFRHSQKAGRVNNHGANSNSSPNTIMKM